LIFLSVNEKTQCKKKNVRWIQLDWRMQLHYNAAIEQIDQVQIDVT
jgi:hypothetical protein